MASIQIDSVPRITQKGISVDIMTTTTKFVLYIADCFDFEDDWQPHRSEEFTSREAAEARKAEIEKTAFTAAWIVEKPTELKAPFMLHVGAYCGGEYREQFANFEDAARECDRLNRQDHWIATLFDADGVSVRDHAAVWK